MQFKHPEILYALFALLIPILVHLFQLRRFQRVDFTNVQFLQSVTLQTRKSSQLKKWLTLLARLFALAAIIIAFAQPFFASKEALIKEKETVVYLDNSFSMEAKGPKGPLFKRAVQELLSSVSEDEEFTIFTNDKLFKNTTIKNSRASLLQLGYSANQLPYTAALLKAKQLFSKDIASDKRVIMVSDFQQKDAPFTLAADSTSKLDLVQLTPASLQNIAIDSLYLTKKSTEEWILQVQLHNYGTSPVNMPVALYDKDKLIAKTAVSLSQNSLTTTSFTLQGNKPIKGEVRIEDPNLQFDNTCYFNINTPDKIKILAINEADDRFLKNIFTPNEFLLESSIFKKLDYNKIPNANLIVLNELKELPVSLLNALRTFSSNGGIICFIPSETGNITSYNQLFSAFSSGGLATLQKQEKKVTTIHFSHPVYQGVFDKKINNFQYPSAKSFYPSNSGNAILSFEDNRPFLSENGNLYAFTAAINIKNSNFKNSPLIVPTLYNLGKLSLQLPELYYTIGQKNTYDIATHLGQDEILSLVKGNENSIPQQQSFNSKVAITTADTPNSAGIYNVQRKDSILQQVTYNYDTIESGLLYHDLSGITNSTITNELTTLLDDIKATRSINKLWKWFVIFALLFLVIEILLLKFLK